MGGLIEDLLNYLNFYMKYFLKVIHCRPVTTRPRIYCAQWVWSTKKIHACPNKCKLYRKEFEELHKCPRCGVSRYKVKDDDWDEDDMKKGPPAKVLWYLSIIPRLRHFFANANDAKNLTWHSS